MGPCTTGRRPRRRFCSWVQPSDQLWWPEHDSRPGGAPAGGAVPSSGQQKTASSPLTAPTCAWQHKQWWRRPARRAGPPQEPAAPLPAPAARPGARQVPVKTLDMGQNGMRMLAEPAVVAALAWRHWRRRRSLLAAASSLLPSAPAHAHPAPGPSDAPCRRQLQRAWRRPAAAAAAAARRAAAAAGRDKRGAGDAGPRGVPCGRGRVH